MRGAFILLFVSLLAQPRPGTTEQMRIFEDPENWTHPERLHLSEEDILFNDPFTRLFGSRAFHFIGRLDDGTQFVIDVFRWEYAFAGGWGMSVLVVQPGGSTYVSEQRIPDQEVSVAEDRFSIRIGDSSFRGTDGSYWVRIHQEEFTCNLRVQSLLPLWQPGDGYAVLDEQRNAYLRLGVHCPWGVTSGYMVVRGRLISASGQCYGDRSRHSYSITRMNSPTLAFRGFSPAQVEAKERWFLSVLQYTTHPSYGSRDIPVLIFAHGGRWVFTTKDYALDVGDFHTEELSPLAFPHRFTLRARRNGYILRGSFVVTELYHLTDILAKIPKMFQSLVSLFFKRPVVFRMLGYFRGTVTHPDGSTERLYLPGQCEYSVLD
jgi:hypothetical protein